MKVSFFRKKKLCLNYTFKMVCLMQERKVVVLANLKPRNMRGVKSCGMLIAASDASHETVELLVPPEGSLPGQRIWFGSENDHQNQPPPATPNQVLFAITILIKNASFLTLLYLSSTINRLTKTLLYLKMILEI